MSPLDTLVALSRGDPAAAQGLLPAARAHAFGAEALGPASIVELFARNPRPLSAAPSVVVAPQTLSAFDADAEGAEQAFVADLHDGLIARLWRVGEGASDITAEPLHALAVDAFLDQRREAVALRLEDHPDLDAAAASALREVAATAVRGPDVDHALAQTRSLVVRAVSRADRAGALLQVAGVGLAPRFAAAAFRFRGDDLTHARVVWDAAHGGSARAL